MDQIKAHEATLRLCQSSPQTKKERFAREKERQRERERERRLIVEKTAERSRVQARPDTANRNEKQGETTLQHPKLKG